MALILLGVVCVGFKENLKSSKEEFVYSDLLLAIGFALITGVCFPIGSLINRYYVRTVGFDPM
jgi:drug/metabolite transporter (DMT)-like permease